MTDDSKLTIHFGTTPDRTSFEQAYSAVHSLFGAFDVDALTFNFRGKLVQLEPETSLDEAHEQTVKPATLSKGDRISFPADYGDGVVYGFIGYRTATGFKVSVSVPGLLNQSVWVDVAFEDATPAPFPGKPVRGETPSVELR